MNESNQNNKAKIVLGYIIPLIGLIFTFSEKNATDAEKRSYAQGATIFIIDIIISIISFIIGIIGIPFIGTIFGILPTVILIFAIIAAVNSTSTEAYKIPVIYDLSVKFFK